MKYKLSFILPLLLMCANIIAGTEDYGTVLGSATVTLGGMDSVRILKTRSGKTITINETHPHGLSTSLIEIIPEGFTNNDSITLGETDPLIIAELTDLDNDGYEELFLFTQSSGSGSSENFYGYASDMDSVLVKIDIKPIPEDEYEEGGVLEGYMGHDQFYFENNMLVREFPVYKPDDTNIAPSGGTIQIYYRYRDFRLEKARVVRKEHP